MAGDKKGSGKTDSGKADSGKADSGKSGRGAQAATIEGVAEEVKKKKRTSPLEFLQQVRTEAEKVTWTSWKETWVSTVMVLVMVVLMAIFFLVVDQTVKFGVCTILPIDCASQSR